ncbi:MAG: Gfo/Idh/MocA family oxidoreductase, partial [Dolichospermum sp.]
MIGVAVVGTGFGQKVHIPAFQAHHQTEIVAVYHRDINKAKTIAATYNIPYAGDNLAEISALPTV